MSAVEVRFTKWGGARHWRFTMTPLGRDEHGHWYGGRAGMTLQRGDEAPVLQPHDFVMIAPYDRWWVASFNGTGETDVAVYVDVATPPVVGTHSVESVDLDLDVIRLRDGSVRVLDEDEFAEHQVRYGYPADVIDRARRTTDELVDLVTGRTEPFGAVADGWLRAFTAGA